MNIVTLDFETFFSDDYTLKKMTTEAYIRDKRFEVHGCGIGGYLDYAGERVRTHWLSGADIAAGAFQDIAWDTHAVLAHHAHFDGLILANHFGIKPKFWLDTLSMARQQHGNHISASLDSVRGYYGLPVKRTPYEKFKNKHWHELTPAVQQELASGCCDEVDSIWSIFNTMAQRFPPELYPWVDNTIRMFTEPKLVGDTAMLADIWKREAHHKANLFAQLGVTAKDLGSDEMFANLLRQLDVEPDVKTTTAGNVKYAFAKTDPFMQELAEDADDDIRVLAEARIEVKSTLQQSRAERLGWMSTRGNMCVYLGAFAAHTNRDGGGDKVNWQNFTRKSNLREGVEPLQNAVQVPPGYLKAKVDKSQIECRILNMFAGQHDVIERFRNKEDPYVGIASQFYGHPVYKPAKGDPRADEMETKRGTGKQLELSCGYGAGGPTIVHTARKGTYGPPVYLTVEEGERAKVLYRSTHTAVVALWKTAGRMISALAGTNQPITWECVEVRTGEIIGPNGSRLHYPELAFEDDEWRYRTRRGRAKLYGAKLIENLIQWLAWIAFQQDICRIGRETGLWPSIREHDAGTWVIRDDQYADQWLAYLKAEMSRPPAWMPGIPLDADGSLSGR